MLEAVRKENGVEVFEMENGGHYLAQFTTNSIESMNAELKRCVDSKLLTDQFINKVKMIVDDQNRHTISHTGDFSFCNKYKNFTTGREWFMWDVAKCKLHQKLVFQKDILFGSEYINFERNTNQDVSVLDNLYSKDLPDQIIENVPDKIITDAKALIFNKHICQSFNGLDYKVSVSHSNRSLTVKVKKRSIVTCSTKECLK